MSNYALAKTITLSNPWKGIYTLYLRSYRSAAPKLSPFEVSRILRANEFSHEFANGPVKSYDSNQLGSNSPMEDRRSEATCTHSSGLLVGVFDGHAGPACSQVSAKRLLHYIAASLLPPDILQELLRNDTKSSGFLETLHDKVNFVEEIRDIYETSFRTYAEEVVSKDKNGEIDVPKAMENSFLRLDDDMSNEAIQNPSPRTLSVAISGAVACVAHIAESDLHVASTGDCCAVLGSLSDNDQWTAKKLTTEHNSENVAEVRRILSEHPANERDSVIRLERLLGQLAPLRALGDYRYKWPRETLDEIVVPHFGEQVIPPQYLTPPYLTALPEVTHHKLTVKDRFLVLATDGLWDMISPVQVVQLIGEHMFGKAFLQPLKLPKSEVTLGEVAQMLSNRKVGFLKKPLDKNAATHLIRNAVGGTEYGIEHTKLSHLLSLPQDIVRLFRDDITVTVIYFDPEYLRDCPISG